MDITEERTIIKILRSHGIQVTRQRVAVLKMMVYQQDIIPGSVINKHFSGLLNRVTVYRVLRDFEKKNLVVKVANPGGDPRYLLALPKRDKPGTRKKQSVFFTCTECGNTTVLQETQGRQIQLPEKFIAKGFQLIVYGLCSNCQD